MSSSRWTLMDLPSYLSSPWVFRWPEVNLSYLSSGWNMRLLSLSGFIYQNWTTHLDLGRDLANN
ncbi:unnamed protein product [Brassica oleracea]